MSFLRSLAARIWSRLRRQGAEEGDDATTTSEEKVAPADRAAASPPEPSQPRAPPRRRKRVEPAGNECHTLLWTNDYCKRLKRAGDGGRRLEVVFGGSHQSQPSLSRFGVGPGDHVAVVRVEKGRLFLVATMQVREMLPVPRYLREQLGLPEADVHLGLWALESKLAAAHPEWGHRLPWGCLTEVAIGDGSTIAFDRLVPREIVEALRFVSRRGERPIRQLADGLIKSSIGLQGGAYRLGATSGESLLSLIDET